LLSTIKKVLILATILILMPGCIQDRPGEFMLLDFESDTDLDKFYWRCHVLYSLSDNHVTHGARSLKMDLFPSEYPGLGFQPSVKDWRAYNNLHFDIFNPSKNQMQINLRIDDKKDYPDYADRYNESITVEPGHNHIIVPLDKLITSGTSRSMDLANIQMMLIFMVSPQRKQTLFIDAVRLR
jgi:hypothetical protein